MTAPARPLDRARAWFGAHRQRLARLVGMLAVLLVAGQLAGAMPRATDVRYEVGEGQRELRVAYLGEDGDEVKGVRFGGPRGVPALVRHEVELSPGRYRIEAVLRGAGQARLVERALEVPAEGVVRIDLREDEPPRTEGTP